MAEVATEPENRVEARRRARRSCTADMVERPRGRSSSTSAAASSCPRSSSCPGQDRTSALLDLARTVVRRAERAAAAGRRRRAPSAALPQPPLVAAVDPRPLGRGRAAAHPHHARPPLPEPRRSPCPSPSSSPAPLPPTWRPSAVGAVAGQSEGGGRRLGLPGRSGLRGEEGRRPRRARRRTAAPRYVVGLGPGGGGRRRRAALRRRIRWRAPPSGTPRSPSTCSAPLPTAPRRGRRRAGDRRGPRARRLPVLRRSSPSRSRSELAPDRDRRRRGQAGRRTRSTAGASLAEAVCWARDLENEPGGSLTPGEARQAGGGRGRLGPASRSRCGTRRRSASRSSAACSA